MADELAGRYAVLDRGMRRVDLAVRGCGTPTTTRRCCVIWGASSSFEDVSVSSASGDKLGMSLITAADDDQLMELFRLDHRLTARYLGDRARFRHRAGLAEALVLAALPNVITVVRIGMVVPTAWLLWDGDYVAALILTGVAGASDAADGWLARRLDAVSQFGAALDPVADKLLIAVIFIIFAIQGHLPVWLAVIVLGRDAVIMTGAGVYRCCSVISSSPPPI